MRRYIFIVAALLLTLYGIGRLVTRSVKPGSVPAPDPHVVISTGTVAENSTLGASLDKERFTPQEAFLLSKSLNKVVPIRKIRAGTNYEVHRSTAGELVLFRYWNSRAAYTDFRPGAHGEFSAEPGKLALDSKMMAVQGTIQTSLWESMRAQGIAPELIYRFTEVFAWEIDFLTETRKGDSYRFVWERNSNDTLELEGKIYAAEYRGTTAGHHIAVRFNEDFFDPEGKSLQRQFLRAPLSYRRISSGFSRRRFQPVLRIYRPHHGIDYAAAYGTPVATIGHGVVTFRGWHGGHGNTVMVRHSGSYATLYGHLSRYAKGVSAGKRVEQGEIIGYVGSTGLSTGPHLHFEFTVEGRPMNFFNMKLPAAQGVSKEKREDFDALKKTALSNLSQAGYATSGPITIK